MQIAISTIRSKYLQDVARNLTPLCTYEFSCGDNFKYALNIF